MYRAALLLAAIVVIGIYLAVVSATSGGSLVESATTTSVFGSTTTVSPTSTVAAPTTSVAPRPASTDPAVRTVEEYWEAVNAGDAVEAVSRLSGPEMDRDAELGYVGFVRALGRTFDARCGTSPVPGVVACQVASPLQIGPEPPHVFLEYFLVDGRSIRFIDRSSVAAVSDAVLTRLAKLADEDAFHAACVDQTAVSLVMNGLAYNEQCGNHLAGFTSDGGWYAPEQAGLWLVTGGS